MGKLLIVGLVMVAAVTLSPAGPVMLLYPFQTVSIESLQDFIQEWQSPNFHERQVWPFAAMIFLLVGAVGRSGRRLDLEDFLLVAGWGFLGLLAGRNIATFALAGSVVLSRHAAPVLQGWQAALGLRMNPDRDPGRLFGAVNDVLVILLLILVVAKAASVYPEAVNREAFEKFLPVEAVEFIREAQPEGRLFNSYNWGAYLLWALPEYPVFVDGRTDLYDDEVISQWFRVVRAEAGWEADLAAWDVRLVLIEPGSPLAGALERGGWERVYVDPVAAVFTR